MKTSFHKAITLAGLMLLGQTAFAASCPSPQEIQRLMQTYTHDNINFVTTDKGMYVAEATGWGPKFGPFLHTMGIKVKDLNPYDVVNVIKALPMPTFVNSNHVENGGDPATDYCNYKSYQYINNSNEEITIVWTKA